MGSEGDKAETISLSDDSASTSGSVDPSATRLIKFNPSVQVAMLPWQERVEARKARLGQWRPAPLSDELWDGDYMSFREDEMSSEEFKRLTNLSKRRKTPMLGAFAKMFLAVSAEAATQPDGMIAGVDMVHARARVFAEDFDEEVRDSDGRLASSQRSDEMSQDSDDTHVVLKLSTLSVDDEKIILQFAEDREAAKSPLPPKPLGKRPSDSRLKFNPTPPNEPSRGTALRKTFSDGIQVGEADVPPSSYPEKRPSDISRWKPSPPSEPYPKELLEVSDRTADENRFSTFRPSPPNEPYPEGLDESNPTPGETKLKTRAFPVKKTSNRDNQLPKRDPFICGEGKRPIYFLPDEPLQEETTWVEESTVKPRPLPAKPLRRKKSLLGVVLSAFFPAISTSS